MVVAEQNVRLFLVKCVTGVKVLVRAKRYPAVAVALKAVLLVSASWMVALAVTKDEAVDSLEGFLRSSRLGGEKKFVTQFAAEAELKR